LFFQVVLSGIAAGSIYALVALGFVLIFKATDAVNFAQGEMVMLGAYLGVTFFTILKLPFLIVFIIVLGTSLFFGMLVERVACRPLMKQSVLTVIIATIAVGIMMKSGARLIWGPELWPFPAIMSRKPLQIGSALITPESLGVIAIAVAAMGVFYLFFKYSKMGKAMRACSQNQDASALMGVNVRGIFSLAWGISCSLAALGGILLAPLQAPSPTMGLIAIPAFAAAIIGGFESLPGAVIGGFLVGIIQNLSGFYISSVLKDIIAFLLLIGILMVKPSGLFGKALRKRV
jgi:branched-chain amino acid transport system permease protein